MNTLETYNNDKPNILFIDDEVRILRSMRLMFRRTHNVYTTTDPHEFRALLREHDMSVVVCDQRMPKITGTQLLREVSEIAPQSMRILLTGYADLAAVIDAINQGQIYRYITKPWNNDDLKKIIDEATAIAQSSHHALTENPLAKRPPLEPKNAKPGLMVMYESETIYQRLEQQFGDQYTFYWAKDINATMDILDKQKISIVITDVHFCEQEIVPVVNALKRIASHIMVIVITTHQDSGILIRLINQGQIFRCLMRPVSHHDLADSLVQAIVQCQLLHTHPEIGERFKVEDIQENKSARNTPMDFIDSDDMEVEKEPESKNREKSEENKGLFSRLVQRIRRGFG